MASTGGVIRIKDIHESTIDSCGFYFNEAFERGSIIYGDFIGTLTLKDNEFQ